MQVTYETTFFDSLTLRQCAKTYLDALPKNIGGLLSTGSSGCAIASAMLALSGSPLVHLHIRKEATDHSDLKRTAGFFQRELSYAIVDDVMDTGDTALKLLDYACNRAMKLRAILIGRIIPDVCRDDLDQMIDTMGVKLVSLENKLKGVEDES